METSIGDYWTTEFTSSYDIKEPRVERQGNFVFTLSCAPNFRVLMCELGRGRRAFMSDGWDRHTLGLRGTFPRLLPACRTKFIARYLRNPTRGMPTDSLSRIGFHLCETPSIKWLVPYSDMVCLFVCLGLWHINLCGLFHAKSIFIEINCFISNNLV